MADEAGLEDKLGFSASTPIFAGMVTGALVASSRGPRAAALAGVLGSVVSCSYWFGESFVQNIVLGKNGRF